MLPIAFENLFRSDHESSEQLSPPSGFAFSPHGHFAITDDFNHRIQIYDGDKQLGSFGEKGKENGQFHYPKGIAVDKEGSIYIADSWNHRIQKFDSSGNFLSKWGSQGSGDGEFSQNPAQIDVDSLDNIYVTEGVRIHKFDSSGNLLATWSAPSHYYIAVDSADHVLIGVLTPPRIRKYASGN